MAPCITYDIYLPATSIVLYVNTWRTHISRVIYPGTSLGNEHWSCQFFKKETQIFILNWIVYDLHLIKCHLKIYIILKSRFQFPLLISRTWRPFITIVFFCKIYKQSQWHWNTHFSLRCKFAIIIILKSAVARFAGNDILVAL